MQYGVYSHTGKVRKCNEDYYYIPPDGHRGLDIIIVADGMGGHNAGDLASRTAVEEILRFFESSRVEIASADSMKDAIYESIQSANHKVYNLSLTRERFSGMGTTLTMAIFGNGCAYMGHVGDSRGYLISSDGVRQITRDHSLVQELLDNGSITRDEFDNHPQKNVITRALGTEETIRIDYYEINLSDGDILLLCTDGLVHHVRLEEYFAGGMPEEQADRIARKLGDEALSRGGVDNITVIAAKYSSLPEKR